MGAPPQRSTSQRHCTGRAATRSTGHPRQDPLPLERTVAERVRSLQELPRHGKETAHASPTRARHRRPGGGDVLDPRASPRRGADPRRPARGDALGHRPPRRHHRRRSGADERRRRSQPHPGRPGAPHPRWQRRPDTATRAAVARRRLAPGRATARHLLRQPVVGPDGHPGAALEGRPRRGAPAARRLSRSGSSFGSHPI